VGARRVVAPGLYVGGGAGIRVEDMRAYELNSVWLGVPLSALMENAGRAVADYLEYRLGGVVGRRVVVFAGKGGNGGDGFVAARHLAARGAEVVVHLAYPRGEVSHPDARANLEALYRGGGVRVVEPGSRGWLDASGADAVVDALLGTGVRGGLRWPVSEAVEAYNAAGGLRVSVDVPSGVDPDTGEAVEGAARSDATVTMHEVKRGLLRARLYTGEIVVAEIGLPANAVEEAGPGDVAARVPGRPRDARKGQGGRVLVVAGSKRYVGAPMLAAAAAARAGADLVYLASTRDAAVEAAARFSSVIPAPFSGDMLAPRDLEGLRGLLERAHSLLVGPGLGRDPGVLETARALVEEAVAAGKPVVVDADGLAAVEGARLAGAPVLLTPHRGELRRLAGGEGPEAAMRLAREAGAVVLLKGPVDYVCSPAACRRNRAGVAAMSVGGTGDVLSGVASAFLARRAALGRDPDPLNLGAAAAWLVGRAGERAYGRLGESMTAWDVVEEIPGAWLEAVKP